MYGDRTISLYTVQWQIKVILILILILITVLSPSSLSYPHYHCPIPTITVLSPLSLSYLHHHCPIPTITVLSPPSLSYPHHHCPLKVKTEVTLGQRGTFGHCSLTCVFTLWADGVFTSTVIKSRLTLSAWRWTQLINYTPISRLIYNPTGGTGRSLPQHFAIKIN